MSAASGSPSPAAAVDTPRVQQQQPRRQLSCLGKSLISFIDGGTFGAAIGGIFAGVSAVSSVTAGSESILGAARTVFRASAASAFSLGVALGGYTGGVCSLERWRGKRDFINPFIVGGIGGALGAIQRVQIHDGQTKRTVLAFSGRGLMAGSASSALLCSVFWYLQQPSRAAREEREKEAVAAQQQQQQQLLRDEQERMQQRQRLVADPETQKVMGALSAGTLDKEEAARRLKLIAARQASEAAAAAAAAAAAPPTAPALSLPPTGDGSPTATAPDWDPFGASSATTQAGSTPDLTLTDGLTPAGTPSFDPLDPRSSTGFDLTDRFANDPGAAQSGDADFKEDPYALKDPYASK